MPFKTEQEKFWAGNFGTEYIERNQGDKLLASNLDFFVKALNSTGKIGTCLEFGANIGMNLKAIKLLFPHWEQFAIEINASAVKYLNQVIRPENVYHTSILEFDSGARVYDLVLIKGVLIHINPAELNGVYKKLVDSCGKYLLVAEYYNPTPVAIPYRGHNDRLFKRDFAGEILQQYPSMELIDYGFSYRGDPKFPQDDINWFLLKKNEKAVL